MRKIVLGLFIGLLLSTTAYSDNWYNTDFKSQKGACIKGPKVPKGWTPLELKKSGFTLTKINNHLYKAELNGNMMFLTKTKLECKEFLNGLNEYRNKKTR